MCRVLLVSRSGYYDWRTREPSARRLRREALANAVDQSFKDSKRIYGYRKVHQDLIEDYELACAVETVRSIMRERGLRAQMPRRFVTTTDSNHTLPVADNVLERDFQAQRPNEKWVSDITYIRTQEGWLYLAAVMDLYNRGIVGWSVSGTINAELACEALHSALRQRCPGPGLLHHSDQGSQYASEAFREILEHQGIQCSMSRKANCWDNACMERFFGSLKGEWIGDTIYKNHEEATMAIFEYIEMFYNTKRRHAALGYKTPAQYEKVANAHGKHAA
jgi:transposase InsO family protein